MPPAGIGRVAIIGAGSVGSTCAYALLLRRITSEILLVDIDTALLTAQVQDLADAAFLSNTKIRASTSHDAAQCDIIVITAGAKQREGESRTDLIDRNYKILESIIGAMKPFRSDAVLLLVSNPVDVLTYFARRMSGLPDAQVIGSGTFLDSVRLRSMLAEDTQVAETAVHAYVLGEHGDSQFVAWSSASIAGCPIPSLLPASSPLESYEQNTMNKAYSIIAAKGATAYGVASVVSSICESILFNQRHVRPVSHWIDRWGCCVSFPAVLGRGGVVKTFEMPLNEKEERAMRKSVDSIMAGVDLVKKRWAKQE